MRPSLCVLQVISLGTPFFRNFNKKNKHLLFAGDLVHIFYALPFFLMCIFLQISYFCVICECCVLLFSFLFERGAVKFTLGINKDF